MRGHTDSGRFEFVVAFQEDQSWMNGSDIECTNRRNAVCNRSMCRRTNSGVWHGSLASAYLYSDDFFADRFFALLSSKHISMSSSLGIDALKISSIFATLATSQNVISHDRNTPSIRLAVMLRLCSNAAGRTDIVLTGWICWK